MTQRLIAALPLALVVSVSLAAPTSAYPRPGDTERVSVATGGGQVNGGSADPAISADGRFVAFVSTADDLIPGDTNGRADVFVHDRQTGTTERASVSSSAAQADGASGDSAISADGRFVAFTSAATNLVTADTNGLVDVFVRDRQAGTTRRVSVSAAGELDMASAHPAISADGRYVAFENASANVVGGDGNDATDIFLRDLQLGVTDRVSVGSDEVEADDDSRDASISADGRFVAFRSMASNLVPGEKTNSDNVFVRDRESATTELISVAAAGGPGNGVSHDPAISADGRFVAFYSVASDLVPGDNNDTWDAFVRDRHAGFTERVTVDSMGAETVGLPWEVAISADGRFVAFTSEATRLVPGDTNASRDAFVYDRQAGVTERVSLAGVEANGASQQVSISGDGRFVAFVSEATNLVAGDTNERDDVFVRDRGPVLGVVGSLEAVQVAGGMSVSGEATVSGQVLAKAADATGDGLDAGIVNARDLGAEIVGAELIYRPEAEDLLFRLRLDALPPAIQYPFSGGLADTLRVPGAGWPGVVYGMSFEVDGDAYEVRAVRAGVRSASPETPAVALYRCEIVCVESGALVGHLGTTAPQVLVSLPADGYGAGVVTSPRAFAALGDVAGGGVVRVDDVDLPDFAVSAPSVELGIAQLSVPANQVQYGVSTPLDRGTFSAAVPTATLAPGTYRVWARACLGDTCSAGTFTEVIL